MEMGATQAQLPNCLARQQVASRGTLYFLCVWVWPFVIAWLDSNAAFDARDPRLICGSRGFLCRLCRYSTLRHVVYLHHNPFCV